MTLQNIIFVSSVVNKNEQTLPFLSMFFNLILMLKITFLEEYVSHFLHNPTFHGCENNHPLPRKVQEMVNSWTNMACMSLEDWENCRTKTVDLCPGTSVL